MERVEEIQNNGFRILALYVAGLTLLKHDFLGHEAGPYSGLHAPAKALHPVSEKLKKGHKDNTIRLWFCSYCFFLKLLDTLYLFSCSFLED